MARGVGRRTWIKLHTHGILHGSISYQLNDAEQSVWVKLLCLAGECNRDGQISDNDGRPFPHGFIAHEIHTVLELLETTLNKCIEEGRITEDGSGIHITNWATYQSEYQRQKPYRHPKEGDPDRFVTGKLGHRTARTKEDLKRIKGEALDV